MEMKKYLAIIGLLLLIGTVYATEANNTQQNKVVIVHLNINKGIVTELYSKVVYSYPPSYIRGQFKSEVLSTDGEIVEEFNVWDPRIRLGREVIFVDNVNFTVVLPFSDNMKTFNLYDKKTGEKLISVDLTDTIVSFCKEHKDDPECAEALKNLDSEKNFVSVAIVTVIVLAVIAIVMRVKKNRK